MRFDHHWRLPSVYQARPWQRPRNEQKAHCEVEALKSLNINKLVVATPHEDALNDRMKAFLEASGFNVLKIQGYGIRKNADLTDMDVHAAYKIAKRLYEQAPEADGVFVPCPRWPTITDVA